jgi:hypothetical protein
MVPGIYAGDHFYVQFQKPELQDKRRGFPAARFGGNASVKAARYSFS